MQDGRRETRKTSKARAHVEIADDRRDASRAQFVAALRVTGERIETRASLQLPHAAHADIAATDDQHARSAQFSCRFHRGRIVAAIHGTHWLPTFCIRRLNDLWHSM